MRISDWSSDVCSSDLPPSRHGVVTITGIGGHDDRNTHKNGASLTVAVIDAYNMSAEDVRNANTRFGHFDVVVKSSSYSSITRSEERRVGKECVSTCSSR